MNRRAHHGLLNIVATLLLCLFAAAAVSRAQVAAAPRRITAVIDSNDRIAFAGGVPPQVKRARDLGAAPGSTPMHHLALVLTRSAARQQALTQYLNDVQNMASPSFHKWLTPAQYGVQFGASTDDIAALSGWLQGNGLTIEKVSPAANVIQFSGSVSQVQTAFNTQLHTLLLQGQQHVANVTAPAIPRALAQATSGIVGLNDFHPRPTLQKGPDGTFDASTKSIRPNFTLFSGSGTPYLYVVPADASTIYDTPNPTLNPSYKGPAYDGTGVTVGVVGDSNVDLAPVTNFREAFLNETSATLNLPTVIIDGVDPGITGDEEETFLDLEVLGGIAPKAKINYYASDDNDLSAGLFNAIERAINDNTVSVLSVSYGECEANLGQATNQFIAEEYQQAAAQGITITVSSGDSGSAGCDSDGSNVSTQGLAVNGLGSTPFNISVGGTDYDVLASNFTQYVQDMANGKTTDGAAPYWGTALGYIPEEPWNDSTISNGALADNTPEMLATQSGGTTTDIIAGGGGVSSLYAKPVFQSALTPADGKRDLPDVAFLAGNGIYNAVWLVCAEAVAGPNCSQSNGTFTASSTFSGAGGTSAATPAFAGMLALLVQATGSRQGQANSTLYALAGSKYASVFHDVATGNNSVLCKTGTPNCGTNNFLTGYDSVAGYDQASGLGSVDAAAMIADWTSVSTAASTTSLTIDGSKAAVSVPHGTSLSFSTGVMPASSTGSVALVTNQAAAAGVPTNNGGQLTIPLTSGVGSLSYNGLPGGNYTVYAYYSGDGTDTASSSTPVTMNIAAEPSSTLLALNVYSTTTGNPLAGNSAIPYGSYVFADPSVYGTAEGYAASLGRATGTFTILDNGASIGTAAIGSGNFGSFPALAAGVYPFTVGAHKLTATYPGDASYEANTSSEVDFTVVKGATTVSVLPQTPSVDSTANDQVQVQVLTSSLATSPTGTITLVANGVTLGTSSSLYQSGSLTTGLDLSYVTFTVPGSKLNAGANTLTATYSGDANYSTSTGTGLLTAVPASFTLTVPALSIAAGATTGNTATVTAVPTNGFAGPINLSCTVTTSPSGAISPITCAVSSPLNLTGTGAVTGTLTVSSTASTSGGAYIITVAGVDAATGKVTASTTTQVTVTVPPSITLTAAGMITIAAGATTGNSTALAVTPTGGFAGSVALSCAVTTAPAAAIDPITCLLSPGAVSVSGGAAGSATLAISSTAPITTRSSLGRFEGPARGLGGAALAFGVVLLIPARRRKALMRLLLLVAGVAVISMTGCGGSKASGGGTTTVPGTTAGAYVVTVTATAAGLGPQAVVVSVTVQ